MFSKYGKRGLIFSLEMTNDQLIHRMAIAKSGITNSKLFDTTSKYRDWETDRKSTRLNSSHSAKSRMPSSA